MTLAKLLKIGLLIFAGTVVPLTPMEAKKPFVQTGTASWYGNEFKGRKMANGAQFKPDDFTAAHRSLPFGTRVRVTNLRNNRSILVLITNRGPYARHRIIDLSRAAARELDMMKSGVARVRIEAMPDEKTGATGGW